MYRVAIVCEGPTDREILLAILDHHLPDFEPIWVQPPRGLVGGAAGPLGGGWKGVRTWCRQESRASDDFAPLLANADLLIIQVDADVAREEEHDPTIPCPPAQVATDHVRGLIRAWLCREQLPDQVLLCVPAMMSETWAFTALYPDDPAICICDQRQEPGCVECREDAKVLLRRASSDRRPRLITSQGGELKNNPRAFAAAGSDITAGWTASTRLCAEARRFDADLRESLRGAGLPPS